MNTLFNNIIISVKRAINNKQFIRKHGNRFLTCYDINSDKRFNGQVINTINPLNIPNRALSERLLLNTSSKSSPSKTTRL